MNVQQVTPSTSIGEQAIAEVIPEIKIALKGVKWETFVALMADV